MQMFFFAVPEDMKLLMREADAQGMAVYPVSLRTEKKVTPQAPNKYEAGEDRFALLPREYSLNDIVYQEGQKHKAGVFEIDVNESPVIIVAPSVPWGIKLDVGSIMMNDESSDRRFSLTERKYGILANLLKRWHRTEKNMGWVGPQTAKLVRESRVVLGLGKKAISLWR